MGGTRASGISSEETNQNRKRHANVFVLGPQRVQLCKLKARLGIRVAPHFAPMRPLPLLLTRASLLCIGRTHSDSVVQAIRARMVLKGMYLGLVTMSIFWPEQFLSRADGSVLQLEPECKRMPLCTTCFMHADVTEFT